MMFAVHDAELTRKIGIMNMENIYLFITHIT